MQLLGYNKGMDEYEKLDKPIDLVVHTKKPTKWILVDRETGEVYQGNPGGFWDKLVVKTKNA